MLTAGSQETALSIQWGMSSQQEPPAAHASEESPTAEEVIEARVRGYAEAALNALPREYAEKLENVQFLIRQILSAEDSARMGIRAASLYGLYEGIPLTRRGGWYNHVTPDRITIFWGPLIRDFPDDGALADKVEKVVYHEIGHYFGLSEADLSHTRMK
jgi:predicted Zn-dependent protease with MMP-like domain